MPIGHAPSQLPPRAHAKSSLRQSFHNTSKKEPSVQSHLVRFNDNLTLFTTRTEGSVECSLRMWTIPGSSLSLVHLLWPSTITTTKERQREACVLQSGTSQTSPYTSAPRKQFGLGLFLTPGIKCSPQKSGAEISILNSPGSLNVSVS